MAYEIVGIIRNKGRIVAYDIIDLATGNTDRFSKEQVIDALINKTEITNANLYHYRGVPQVRVDRAQGNKSECNTISIVAGRDAVTLLRKLRAGTPLKIKIGSLKEFKQIIYAGNDGDKHYFYAGADLDGVFGFTDSYIINNSDRLSFKNNDNDPVKVQELTRGLTEYNKEKQIWSK